MHYNRSETLKELAPALVKAMGEIGPALKDKNNPHFKSKYADLPSCHAVSIRPLLDNGFSFPMFPSYDSATNTVSVTALLLHTSGEFLEGTITLPLRQGANAQDVLAAETYGRRGLYSMVGVVPDDDDDGETAVGRGNGRQDARPEPRREPPAPKPVAQEKRPSEPPKQLTQELTDRGVIRPPPAEGDDDSKPAKSNEALDHALHQEFDRLKALGKNPQQLMMLAKEGTGLHPNNWTIADGRKFLHFSAERFPQ